MGVAIFDQRRTAVTVLQFTTAPERVSESKMAREKSKSSRTAVVGMNFTHVVRIQ
jgi:hypothetical protein